MTTTVPDNHQVRFVVRVLLHIGDCSYQLGDAELAYEIPAIRALLASTGLSEAAPSIPAILREQIVTLCERLGMEEPLYSQLGLEDAKTLLARLQADEEELWHTVERSQAASPSEPATLPIDKALVRQLKGRWRAHTGAQGSVDELVRAWERFKQRVCGEAVSDRSMRVDQYEQLLTTLTSPPRERTRQ